MNYLNFAKRKILGGDKVQAPEVVGMLDVCTSSYMSGWCCHADRTPSHANVFLNGERILRIAPNMRRDDLVVHGFDPDSGFAVVLPHPLKTTDDVRVCADDGRDLINGSRNFHRERLSRLMIGIAPETMMGLEMGPLDRPILSKRDGDVRYVDHASGDDLRRKYAGTPPPLLYPERIVDVDYVWADGEMVDKVGVETKFDYCLASHVMEHVANPIWWLRSIAEVMKPGGTIALVLPEQSRSFDYRRTLTSPSDLIEAYVLDYRRPSVRQVFDHLAFVSYFHLKDHDLPAYDTEKLKTALETARSVEEQKLYFDTHCNVFTVESFKECWDVIDRLDLVPLTLKATFEPYPPLHDEFIVTFTRR